jgi:putative membrane protein
MKAASLLGAMLGLLIVAGLSVYTDIDRIWTALFNVGWAMFVVIALHLPQTLFSALGWRGLVTGRLRPSIRSFFVLRWIRESVNALLPVAQVGGDVVRGRLLAQRGIALGAASASVAVDTGLEIGSQAVFAAFGLVLLVARTGLNETNGLLFAPVMAGLGLIILLVALQRFRFSAFAERSLLRFAERTGLRAVSGVAGLHERIVALCRNPRQLWLSTACHMAAWFLGGFEILAALWALGMPVDLVEALVIEALSQAVRSAGFVIPGALGVQELGYMLVCSAFGIGPETAISLSLLRRIRELALGLPGLAAWHRLERRHLIRTKADAVPLLQGEIR